MSEWRTAALGDVITLQRGFDLTQKEATPGPYPVISSGGPGYTTDVPRVDGPGVVTGRKGVLGKVFYERGAYWPHDTTLWVKDFKGSAPRYIYYLLQTLPLASLDTGAANPTLNRNHAHLLPVLVPELNLQVKIADTLGAFDDLIENNRRRVDVLEEMARAIYREWFFQFRFPGYANAKMVDSALGRIPESWDVGVLGDLADEVRNAVTPSTATTSMPYVPIDEIDRRSLTLKRYRPGEEAASSLRLFKAGDVLFGAMRAYFHKVCVAPFDGVTRSTCFVLRPRSDRYLFAVMTLADDATVAYAARHSSGSTIPYAKWANVLSEMPVVLPPTRLTEGFSTVVDPLLRDARTLAEQSTQLAGMRDLVLPKLVTGQIDVSSLHLDALAEGAVA